MAATGAGGAGGDEAGRLRAARLKQGRSAASVARALALSQQYIGDIEHGRRVAPGRTYARLCAELGIENDRPEAEVVRLRAALDAARARLAALERALVRARVDLLHEDVRLPPGGATKYLAGLAQQARRELVAEGLLRDAAHAPGAGGETEEGA